MNLTGLHSLADFERAANLVLDDTVRSYVAGGAGAGRTVDGNRAAFDGLWLVPHILSGTTARPRTEVTIFGRTLSIPVLLAPTSPQRLLHQDAEIASAAAAAEAGTIAITSSDSHYSFPDIASSVKDGCWFQLYAYRSRADVEATVAMADEAGASALVVTVDAQHPARRVAALRAGFRTPPNVDLGNLRALGILDGEVPASARLDRLPITWDDLAWLRDRTRLPLVVKGVLRVSDARRCVGLGVDGVIVSNHGGRQLDAVVPSLVALEAIAAAVGDECAVLVDGGVRSGTDVVKALCRGAHAVCIGRPYLWGLALAGQDGVGAVLNLVRDELEDAMRQLGVSRLSELGPELIVKVPRF